ncbi:hypothetical protein GCM10022406_06320 [Hymenobacter algoricola]|uniref:Uncharacterized protein n=1 Tax=Hymenobacter algoricola TaxID=486267 RepID=A0ABP7MKE5_9BACT
MGKIVEDRGQQRVGVDFVVKRVYEPLNIGFGLDIGAGSSHIKRRKQGEKQPDQAGQRTSNAHRRGKDPHWRRQNGAGPGRAGKDYGHCCTGPTRNYGLNPEILLVYSGSVSFFSAIGHS